MYSLAPRVNQIEPFYVMEVVKEANRLAAQGQDIIHLSIGEPDFTAIPAVLEALQTATYQGHTGYTPALGITPLREAIANFYTTLFGATIDPNRVLVTAGASGALQLACSALVKPGGEVLMADPAYPCNRHFVTAAGGVAKLIPTDAQTRFQLSFELVKTHWTAQTQGVLVASPSNPTGTAIEAEELRRIVDYVRARHGFVLVDEIYLGLLYEGERRSAAILGDDLIIINSFSKYFHMTGWRLGWMLVPPCFIDDFEKLAQNFFICPSALAQHAALACFSDQAIAQFEQRRQEFKTRRDFLLPALRAMGLSVPVTPDGAFYIYADVSAYSSDSMAFCLQLLQEQGVCVVPGKDFGLTEANRYIRFSYATDLNRLEQAVARIKTFLSTKNRINAI